MSPITRLALVVGLVWVSQACKTPGDVSDGSNIMGTESGSCREILTQEEELRIVNAATNIASMSLNGSYTASQRDAATSAILSGFNSDRYKNAAAKAAVIKANDFVASSWLFPVALNWNSTSKLTEAQLNALESLGVARELAAAYVEEVSIYLKPFYVALLEHGGRFEAGKGWVFNVAGIHHKDLKAFPDLTSAFLAFFGPQVTAGLLSNTRTEAIFIDGSAFLPPDATGLVPTLSRAEWESRVKQKLKVISDETDNFVRSSKAAASYSNLMQGRVLEWFGVERGSQGRTAPEIQMESSYKFILQASSQLSDQLGVGPEMRQKILDLRKTLNDIEKAHLESGLAKLSAAERAAIAAPFIPALMWAAPYAGALMGPTWVPVIANATNAMAAIPLAYAAGSAALSAGIKSATLGGSFLCNFYDDLVDKESDALFQAPFLAALPAAMASGAAGAAFISSGAVCAPTVYGVFNLTFSVTIIKSMTEAGVTGLTTCYEDLKGAEAAGSAGNSSLVELHVSKAWQECAQAGVDIGIAAVQGSRLTAKAIESIQKKDLKPLLGANCFSLSGDCNGQREKRAPGGLNEFKNVTDRSERLHQNGGDGERYSVIKRVPLDSTASAPGHDYLRRPEAVAEMGRGIAASNDRGYNMFRGKDKIVLNVYTNERAQVTGIEVVDGNHRFAAGLYAERLAPGRGWKTIGDIPFEFLEIRVNGYNSYGQKLPRWVPLHTVQGTGIQGWREIPPEWGARGPTAEIPGDLPSTSSQFRPEHRGVSLNQVLWTSMNRIGLH